MHACRLPAQLGDPEKAANSFKQLETSRFHFRVLVITESNQTLGPPHTSNTGQEFRAVRIPRDLLARPNRKRPHWEDAEAHEVMLMYNRNSLKTRTNTILHVLQLGSRNSKIDAVAAKIGFKVTKRLHYTANINHTYPRQAAFSHPDCPERQSSRLGPGHESYLAWPCKGLEMFMKWMDPSIDLFYMHYLAYSVSSLYC